jgi:hypothetical protein
MNSNRNCRWVAGVGIAVAAALIGLAPAARADDMQISIDGYDLFPTAGNLATADSSLGDMAIAIGNGADANALNDPSEIGNFGNFAFADGAGESANAGGGVLNAAFTFGGTDSQTYAGFNGNFDLALATANNDAVLAGGGTEANPANLDIGIAQNPGYVVDAGPGDFQVESAAALPASSSTDLDPFQDLFGDSGINTWTPSVDSLLASSDPTEAASLDTSVDNFWSSGDSPISSFVAEQFPGSFGVGDSSGGLPVNGIGDLAVGLDYGIFTSGLAPTLDPGLSEFFFSSLPTFSSDALFLLFFPEDLLGLISLG